MTFKTDVRRCIPMHPLVNRPKVAWLPSEIRMINQWEIYHPPCFRHAGAAWIGCRGGIGDHDVSAIVSGPWRAARRSCGTGAFFGLHRRPRPAAGANRASIAAWPPDGAQLDAATAASMISGYRSNNGLSSVSVDAELMKLAEAQAQRDGEPRQARPQRHPRVQRAAAGRRATAPRPRPRTSAPAIIRWRKRSQAGATFRRTAPTCCSTARPAWASPRSTRRNRNTRCSGR